MRIRTHYYRGRREHLVAVGATNIVRVPGTYYPQYEGTVPDDFPLDRYVAGHGMLFRDDGSFWEMFPSSRSGPGDAFERVLKG